MNAPGQPLDTPPVIEAPDPDRPLPPVAAVAGVVLFMIVAALAALLAVMFVPVRLGTIVFPVSVVFAALTNVVLPTMSRRLVDSLAAGIAPVVAWFVTVFLLAQARPEGDVLLPGKGALSYVAYAVMIVGALAGGITVFRTESRRTNRP